MGRLEIQGGSVCRIHSLVFSSVACGKVTKRLKAFSLEVCWTQGTVDICSE